MWKTHVLAATRASLSYREGRKQLLWKLWTHNERSLLLPQVPNCQTPTLFQHSPFHSHFSDCASSKFLSFNLQKPRFLSTAPSNQSSTCDYCEEALVGGTETEIDTGASVAQNLFDEMRSSTSSTPSSSSPSSFHETDDGIVFEENPIEYSSEYMDERPLASNDGPAVENVAVSFEQLQSVLSLLQSSGISEGSLDSVLEGMDLSLNEEFVVRVLETPLVPGHHLIAFFKWVIKKPDFVVSTRSVSALVQAICIELRRKNAYALWDLVQELGAKENGVLNTKTLNELISLLSRLGKGKAAFEVFNEFGELGCDPNADTYYLSIEALTRRSLYDWACSVCEKMLSNDTLPDSDRIGKIITSLCKGSKAKDAHRIYISSVEKEKCPPQPAVNYLIGSLCQEDETVHLASKMLDDFTGNIRKYAIKPFSSVVKGLCRIKDVKTAKELLSKMIDAGPPPGNAVFNTIINSLSKVGEMEAAMEMLNVMENRGLKPDVYTYSVIMSGYVKGGAMEEARKVLTQAKKKHSKLSPVTYHTLIRGYCKLEQFDKALGLLNEMEEFGVKPNTDEYNKLIQSLCLKAVDWATAEKLLEEMKENGLHLNGITKGLIRAVKELEAEGLKTNEA